MIDSIGDCYSKAILVIIFIIMVAASMVFGILFLGCGGVMYCSFVFLFFVVLCVLLMLLFVYVVVIGVMVW